MRRRTLLLGAVSAASAWMGGCASGIPTNSRRPSVKKRVFAHYMVAWPRGGPNASIDDYIAEFRDAQQCGIDGFALNCGGWSRREPHYRARVLTMYRAAAQYGNDFKLFVSADGDAQDELDDVFGTTADLDAQLRIAGQPLLSAYALGGRSQERRDALITRAKSLGAYLVPHFMPSTGEGEIDSSEAKNIAIQCGAADGYFYFGAAGAPESLARSIGHLATALKSAGKIFMAPVTPYYRGLPSGKNYRAFETDGFAGMTTEWLGAIRANADWVQIVTWNDWSESTYVAPISSSTRAEVYDSRFGALLNHTGYLNASRYFIEWFKYGLVPTITRDELYYFYRLHPVDVAAVKDAMRAPRSRTPLTALIHVTTFLKESATLEILQGTVTTTHELPAGVSEVVVAAFPGAPRFRLSRKACVVIDKIGEEAISSNDFSSAFNYFSGGSTPRTCPVR